ncbi:MAG: MFS transporter, partial [Gammaproteobacteria bacterium]|nr:MFS transporter [Gammaproteobacteria bacterium]
GPDGASATFWALMLLVVLIIMTLIFSSGFNPERVIVSGLVIFGGVFAVNSAIHSYLILAYSSHEQVSVDVGFYYMANALGRLVGTVLSGWMFQRWGLEGCLWAATVFVLASMLISVGLPKNQVLSEK